MFHELEPDGDLTFGVRDETNAGQSSHMQHQIKRFVAMNMQI